MENIKIAEICGLCLGCKNAINLALNKSKTNNVTTLKEIVHNKNINNFLNQNGINCINNLEDLNKNSIVVIRAHGEPPKTYEYLKNNNIDFLDGTCINVKNIHKIVEKYYNDGYKIIIIGKYGKFSGIIHPEVAGIIGYCQNPILIEDIDDVEKLYTIKNSKFFVVCQTTFNPEKFSIICDKISILCQNNKNEIIIKNTICNAQKLIQKSSLSLAKSCDLMIIVGGMHSSNTIELYQNIKQICTAIHIEDISNWKNEIDKINFKISKETKIGLTAGASTDKRELDELKNIIENYLNKKEG